MILNRRFLILAGALVAASAAYGAITTDKLIIRGRVDRPAIETNAPIAIRYFPTVLTGHYTVNPAKGDYPGKVFILRGTAHTHITLPQPSEALAGYRYTFINDVDYNMIIVCSNKMYFDNGSNSSAGTQLNITTATRKRGAVVTVLCSGSFWYIESITASFPFSRS